MARTRYYPDSDTLHRLGIPPWELSEPLTGYVRGEYDDTSPIGAVLWCEIRRAYRRNGIGAREATMWEMRLAGQSCRRIAELFRLHHSTISCACNMVQERLEADAQLGLITVIVEECGGWSAVADVLF